MTTTIVTISRLVDALGTLPLIVPALTKGSLLILVAVIITRLLVRAPAAGRHLVWALSVAGLLLLPATKLLPWRLELPALTSAPESVPSTPVQPASAPAVLNTTTESPADAPGQATPANPGVTSTSLASSTSVSDLLPARLRDPASVLMLIWAAGVLWMLARLGIGVANVRRVVADSAPMSGADWHTLRGACGGQRDGGHAVHVRPAAAGDRTANVCRGMVGRTTEVGVVARARPRPASRSADECRCPAGVRDVLVPPTR